jgi:hypothetical protein
LILRDLHRAHHLADDPRLLLWTEFLLLAHLVGRPTPHPDAAWLEAMATRATPRILAEAVEHRLRTAVDLRYTGLTDYYPPEQLAEHLCATAEAALHGTPSPCAGGETWWQAGRYRWIDVESALRDPTVPPHRPHPSTDRWAERGLHLPGTTLTDQRTALHAHPDTWADPRVVIPDPALLPTAIDRLSRAEAIEQRLEQATSHLRGLTRWPLALLGPHHATPPPQDNS